MKTAAAARPIFRASKQREILGFREVAGDVQSW